MFRKYKYKYLTKISHMINKLQFNDKIDFIKTPIHPLFFC